MITHFTGAPDLQWFCCTGCGERLLYVDQEHDVWCAGCPTWNGWFVGNAWARPFPRPERTPDGQEALF